MTLFFFFNWCHSGQLLLWKFTWQMEKLELPYTMLSKMLFRGSNNTWVGGLFFWTMQFSALRNEGHDECEHKRYGVYCAQGHSLEPIFLLSWPASTIGGHGVAVARKVSLAVYLSTVFDSNTYLSKKPGTQFIFKYHRGISQDTDHRVMENRFTRRGDYGQMSWLHCSLLSEGAATVCWINYLGFMN